MHFFYICREHIPGASYFNIFVGADFNDLFPRNQPDASAFEKQAIDVGLTADSHVVVYDTTGAAAGFFIGSRAWWTFKVIKHVINYVVFFLISTFSKEKIQIKGEH